jgi:hypothetical protein
MMDISSDDETFLRTVFLEMVMDVLVTYECMKTPDPQATAAKYGELVRGVIARSPMPDGEAGENFRLHLEDISNSFFDNLAGRLRHDKG